MKKILVFALAFCFAGSSFADGGGQAEFEKSLNSIQAEMTETAAMPVSMTSKYLNTSDLKDLLRDRDPEVRKMAVKNSKSLIHNSSIYDLVLDIYEDERERSDIRIEAARALSYATGAWRVTDALQDAIKYDNLEKPLKIMSYKALWNAAASRSSTRDFLVSRLRYDEKDQEIQKAVIWSLFAASPNSRVYGELTDIIKYGNAPNYIKTECVKSLYLAMGRYRVRDLVMDIAKYKTSGEDRELRKTAIFALSGAIGHSRVKRFLEDLVEDSRDMEIRETALEALAEDRFKINEFFHLNYKLENGGYFNPIENE